MRPGTSSKSKLPLLDATCIRLLFIKEKVKKDDSPAVNPSVTGLTSSFGLTTIAAVIEKKSPKSANSDAQARLRESFA